MHVLLTGSSGWLGRSLARLLRARDHKVLGLDVAAGPYTQMIGSVADGTFVDGLFKHHRFDGVIHAGALHKPDIERHSRQAFVDTNVTGTLNLLQAAVRHRIRRFVFTSTTSLMITQAIRDERTDAAVWLDEQSGPLNPRNIYGVTKRAAEHLCRLVHNDEGLATIVLRTARFFPEEDDTERSLSDDNLKANEFLNRRLTVADCARAHLVALEQALTVGFGLYLVSAPTPFRRDEVQELKIDAPSVIARHFPDAPALYAERGWSLPRTIGRVYDSSRVERELGFRCETDFASILAALRDNAPLPFALEQTYTSRAPVA